MSATYVNNTWIGEILEIKTETTQQHDCEVKEMVAQAKIDREEEISKRLNNVFKEK